MLGASGEGLKSQYITLHVDKIDGVILKKKLDEMKVSGAIAPLAMMAVDQAPKFVIDTALPLRRLWRRQRHRTRVVDRRAS
jgi:hypothetical protein